MLVGRQVICDFTITTVRDQKHALLVCQSLLGHLSILLLLFCKVKVFVGLGVLLPLQYLLQVCKDDTQVALAVYPLLGQNAPLGEWRLEFYFLLIE